MMTFFSVVFPAVTFFLGVGLGSTFGGEQAVDDGEWLDDQPTDVLSQTEWDRRVGRLEGSW